MVNPVVVAVGGGAAHGSASICHCEATLLFGLTGCVHATVAAFDVTADVTIAVGCRHVGAGAHVIVATHPALFTGPSLLKLKVQQPSALVEVNGHGFAVPQKAPAVVN